MQLDWFASIALVAAFLVGWVACSRWMRSKYILTDRVEHLAESREFLSDYERYGGLIERPDEVEHRREEEG
ncbi:hypothetical protein J5X84_18050 [Streptosporangiaceae bacterium NEAU-GS5]|nr:hypothetical protein [Streptosporangiaceae bacterium NEAU-GS5]